MRIYENHALAPYTTMGIGGNARRFIEAESADDIVEALSMAEAENAPVFVLGAGSNLLICDAGFDGYVIHPVFKDAEWMEQEDGSVFVRIDAGAMFDDIAAESCRRNLGGIEALSGIPGSTGGSLVQNIGAYGQEISEVFISADAVDRKNRETVTLSTDDMKFAYRHTALKTHENPYIVTSVTIRLMPFDVDKAVERSAKHGFPRIAAHRPESASALRELVLETRRKKGMCYDENDVNTHSVGSFFVNPVLSEKDAQRHNAANIIKNQKPMPCFPFEGGVKLSAAWLIEQSEFNRGFIHKGAALSALHCLAIVNRDHASCTDVLELAHIVIKGVFKHFRIELKPEVIYLGEHGEEDL